VEAAKGRPQRIKQFAKDIKRTDPVYNLGAAGVSALKGDSKEASLHLKRAAKSINEHPGFAVAEAYGAKGIVGRGAGAAGRSGALGEAAKRAASTERAPRHVANTAIEQRRVYSKDITQKAGQVAVEKTKRAASRSLRKRAAAASPDEAAALRDRAARLEQTRMPAREVQRRVDERMAVNEDLRRLHRGQAVTHAQTVLKPVERRGTPRPLSRNGSSGRTRASSRRT
jgi:hypothetical protein